MLKTILITGATDGIGKHLAQKMANEGHEVIIHGRNPEKLRKALSDIQLKSGNQQVHAYLADFSIMSDVYHFAHEIKTDFQKIDVLFNNAGLYAGSQRQATAEDVELTFMLSVQVPYILTTELLPLLGKSDAGRVINTSSFMHHFAKVKNLDFGMTEDYTPGLAYNNGKLYTIWLSHYLAQKLQTKATKVTINSYHPGLISTNLGNDSSDAKVQSSFFSRMMKFFSKDLDQGIETGYYLSLSDEVASITGRYFDGKKLKRVSYKGYSEEKAARLIRYCDEKIEQYKVI
ncbi:MAG: SDR family NAD(P)-dependent oxidoreductase [Trichococcus sp.]|uniref:SDR family NAD(P)-dependent oxidoreductase n=1 Tax=Trichococcus sp. TaxID=1985464 RepID=UPI003C5A6FDF